MDPEQPPKENSPDLTEAEIGAAQVADTKEAFLSLVEGYVKTTGTLPRYELRRRVPHLYCRLQSGSANSLLVRLGWLSDD